MFGRAGTWVDTDGDDHHHRRFSRRRRSIVVNVGEWLVGVVGRLCGVQCGSSHRVGILHWPMLRRRFRRLDRPQWRVLERHNGPVVDESVP